MLLQSSISKWSLWTRIEDVQLQGLDERTQLQAETVSEVKLGHSDQYSDKCIA